MFFFLLIFFMKYIRIVNKDIIVMIEGIIPKELMILAKMKSLWFSGIYSC